MEYIIESVEKKTSKNGKPYAVLFLKDVAGTEFKTTCWDVLDTLVEGAKIEGEVKQSGDYFNFKPKSAFPDRPKWMPPKGIAAAQETKRQDIETAQERKKEAIQLAGAMRDATLVTLASLKDQPFPTEADFKREYEAWVKYFLNVGDQPFL